jgi:two-component system, NarL family, nitrate/nitrite response regulator NarL
VIRVLVVAGVRLYEEGLARVLDDDGRFRVAGTARTSANALALLRELDAPPEVLLLDIARPDGVSAVRAIRDEFPEVRVVALAVREVDEDIVGWAEAGVAGLVPLEASLEDLTATVESVVRGETLMAARTAAVLLERVAELARVGAATAELAVLTPREREIATLIEEGLSNKEIAARLHIELPTVKNHVHHILGKLQVRRRSEAAAVLRGTLPLGGRTAAPS